MSRELDALGLSRRLAKYGIKPRVHRTGTGTARGYAAADLVDTWRRYLPEEGKDSSEDTTTTVPQIPPVGIGIEGNGALAMPPEECVTGVTSVTSTFPGLSASGSPPGAPLAPLPRLSPVHMEGPAESQAAGVQCDDHPTQADPGCLFCSMAATAS